MIYKRIPCSIYYLEHFEELDKKFPNMPLEKRCLIMKLHPNGKTVKKYSDGNAYP